MKAAKTDYKMSKREAAVFLGIGEGTLNRWVRTNRGPHFRRIGGKLVRFRMCDLVAWIEHQPAGGERTIVGYENTVQQAAESEML
jgi:excisionase family DNA binding protein